MEYIKLGKSDLNVSRICLGCMGFGDNTARQIKKLEKIAAKIEVLAERYAEDLKENLPEADGFFGNGDLSKIVITAKEVMQNKRPVHKFAQKGVCGANRNLLLSFAGTC